MSNNYYNQPTNVLKYFLLWLCMTNIVLAQKQKGFVYLSTENGLSQSDVNTIFQDKQGYMWFGTHDGLNRYNGYDFTVFKPTINDKNSISSNLIWKIIGDHIGNLWIGTTGEGLNYYNKTNEKFISFKNKKDNPNSLSNNHVTALFTDSKNRLWIGTNKGMDMLDLKKPLSKAVFNHIDFNIASLNDVLNFKFVNIIFEDSKNNIWVGARAGLFKLSRDKRGDPYFELINNAVGLTFGIVEDEFGKVLIASDRGLFQLTNSDNQTKLITISNNPFSVLLSIKGYLWAGSSNGLFCFENKSATVLPKQINQFVYDPNNPDLSLSKNQVKSLCVDRMGILWVGLNGGGVNKFDPHVKVFRHLKKNSDASSISNDKVRAIFEDSNKTLWIGTEGGGLNVSTKNNQYNDFKKLTKLKKIYALAEVKEGNTKKLLIGGESGIGLYELDITSPNGISDANMKEMTEVNQSVFSILVDSHKNIWLGTYNSGVHRWLATNKPGVYIKDVLIENPNDPSSISNNIIRSIYEDYKGNIWFGTGDGLCQLSQTETRKLNPKFTTYKNNQNDLTSLSHNYILSIFESSNKDLWVGTFGGGINKLVYTDNKVFFKRFTEKEGLANNVVKGILEDNYGNLWISSNKGLSRFNYKTEKFKNYDVNDGLQSNEFSELACFKRSNDEMLFGGVNGFNAFYPSQIKDNLIQPKTVFSAFSIFKKPIGIGESYNGHVILNKSINTVKEIELFYNENSFSVEFAALHYTAPRKNKYAYKLVGFNDDWIYTTYEKRFASYTNLSPGTYTLLVKSSNNDGVWNETPAELKIEIVPPFWRSNFAYFIYLLLFILCLWLFRRFTIIRSAEKHQLELEVFEKEKHDEMHRLKLEFFTNISHEFRTPLTLIKGPLEYLQTNSGTISTEKVEEQYHIMHKNIDYLLRLVNQLLDFRKMDKGKMDIIVWNSNIFEFLKLLGEPFQFLSRKKNIDFKITSKLSKPLLWFDNDALEKIMNNLLSNAFKFTSEGGKIQVEVYDGENHEFETDLKLKGDYSDYVVIKVKDSGVGIPIHLIKYVFERFYVNSDSRSINAQGTGIGLDFTKKLVELHQGQIEVINNKKQGASFFIWLPKDRFAYENKPGILFGTEKENNVFTTEENAETHAVEVLDELVDQSEHKSRSKLPVLLIVEDNADIRLIIKNGLEKKYDIYEAENGQRGLELANKLIPNIILTDIFMPIMDGIEMCDKLKTTSETSHIPVVMLTAKTSQEWEIEGLKNGADGYIRKPFDMELVELKLRNILKNRNDLRKKFNREVTLQPNEVTVTSADERFLQKAIELNSWTLFLMVDARTHTQPPVQPSTNTFTKFSFTKIYYPYNYEF